MKSRISLHGLAILLALITSCSNSATNKDTFNTELTAGFNLLPVPQQVSFSGNYFTIGNDWTLESGNKLTGESKAVSSLLAGLKELGGPEIKSGLQEEANLRRRHFIRLSILPGSVHPLASTDTNSAAIEEQAYRLNLDASGIIINANAPQGLFYGVQTLLQLMRTKNGKVILPEGEITDWPDLELRMIYWDCAHHLERMEAFKHAIRQAAYYKINAIALKLEGHFQFESAEPVVEPYALTPAEYQELTDYAMDNFVQLTPYLDAPAHVSFILKHPEYKSLREFPNINYEFSVTDPKAEELITGMFNDLISANRGVKYIHLSTDEAYYVGKSAVEKKAAEAMGGNGKLLADFITRISDRLHENGRTVIFWGEYPLTLPDIEALPAHLVNGEYNEDWASAFKNKGIRQLIYISTQGVEPLFPNYYRLKERLTSEASETPVKSDDEEQQPDASKGRVGEMLKTIQTDIRAGNSDFMGVIVAAWGDAGLHTETFWLGYAAGCSAAWNTDPVSADELSDRFFNSFYGPEAVKMKRVYQLLSTQAEFWRNSWRQVPSQLRTPVLGNS
jgi:hexosaminidase